MKQNATTVEEKKHAILELFASKEVYEDVTNLRKRVAKLKELLQEYKKKFPVIVVVSHYHTIEFLRAKGFTEDNDLIEYQGIINCFPYFESFEELAKIK